MPYILGIDQGSSKTTSIIVDLKGNIHGFGRSKGANPYIDGLDYAVNMVYKTTLKAIKTAKIDINQIKRIVAGMNGADWPHEYSLLREAIQKKIKNKQVTVYNDSIIAMRGGLDKPYGAILCAGSGLNCAVRNERGEEFIFGYYIDDNDQGGTALGRRVVRAVLDAETQVVPPTALKKDILNFFSVDTTDKLLKKRINNKIAIADYRNLVPLIIKVAQEGDILALNILEKFGMDIAKYVVAGLRKMDMQQKSIDVVLSGGIFKIKVPILKDAVSTTIHRSAPNVRLINAIYEPVVGAGLLALEKENVFDMDDAVKRNIYRSSKRFKLHR